MTELEVRLDGLALLGFDAYMQRRRNSAMSSVRSQTQVSTLLRRLGMGDEYFEDDL